MLSFSIGPVALPVAPLLLLLGFWLATWVAASIALRRTADASAADAARRVLTIGVVAGLVAARLAHLALNADAYAAEPLAILDLRDGGWHAPSGWAVGAAIVSWTVARRPTLRWPVAGGAAAGIVAWATATALLVARAERSLPTLSFKRLDGGAAAGLREVAQGRPLVVNLWASWCAPCRQEMPTLAAAQQREREVGFVFVNQGESEASVRAYLAGLGQPLREVLLDPRATLGPAVGSRGLPTTLFYDADGRLVDAHFGVLSAPALLGRLRQLRPAR